MAPNIREPEPENSDDTLGIVLKYKDGIQG